MQSLSRDRERSLSKGFTFIVGVDEAGRGPLAGPVVAAAAFIDGDIGINGIIDSKATIEEDREKTFEELVNCKNFHYGISIIANEIIDQINILEASMLAMKNATDDLISKLPSLKSEKTIALVDGNKLPSEMAVHTNFVIKGDSFVYSIAAASIIAKVTRDRLMKELDKRFPQYRLAKHKGYPTFEHRSLVMQHGPSVIHRMSFGPVKLAYEKHGFLLGEGETADKNTPSKEKRRILSDVKDADVDEEKKGNKRSRSNAEVETKVESKKRVVNRAASKKGSKKEEKKTVEIVEVGLRRSARLKK